MKAINLRSILFTATIVFSCIVFNGCDDDDELGDDNMYTISGAASGTQVVPSVSGSGAGNITGTYNANTNVLTYTSTWTNLTGAPTSAAFFAGASGAAGTMAGSAWSLGTGLTSTGTFSGTMTLTDAQEAQLLAGGWYYSYNTTANPNGEIRGQITAVS